MIVYVFLQLLEIDFVKMFVLIVKKKLLQIYLAICAFFRLIIHQGNIVKVYITS